MYYPLQSRLTRLAESFHQLKERLQEAVATEMGKVVADAVRDWVTTALDGRWPMPDRSPEPAFPPSRLSAAWAEHDPWSDDERPEELPDRPGTPAAKPPGWVAALSLGFVATRWLVVRRLPFVPALGAGALLGALALVGGPLVQATLAAGSAAADLVRLSHAEPTPAH